MSKTVGCSFERPRIRCAAMLAALLIGVAATAQAQSFRFEVGGGIVHSDYDLSLDTDLGPFRVDARSNSALGGSGPLLSAGFWADGVSWPNLSLGVEYLRGRTDSDLDLDLGGLGPRVGLDADLKLKTQSLFLNAAWRPNEGALHPQLGVGVGTSWLDGRIKTRGRTDLLGGREVDVVDFDKDALAPSGQVFAGLDYDLGRRVYVGLVGRYLLIDGRIFNESQVLREMSAQAKLGVRF